MLQGTKWNENIGWINFQQCRARNIFAQILHLKFKNKMFVLFGLVNQLRNYFYNFIICYSGELAMFFECSGVFFFRVPELFE